MNFLRNNSFLAMVLFFSVVLIGVAVLTDKNIEHTESIYVSHGETLWSLADDYRGKMSKHDWIQQVKYLNDMESTNIQAGATIVVPVIENAIYLEKGEQQQTVKVANK
jgi:hypothetical protein